MNYIDVLNQAANAPARKPRMGRCPSRAAIDNSANVRRDRSDAKFLKVMKGKRLALSEIAIALKTTSSNIQHRMHGMEQRGLVRRVGFRGNAALWAEVPPAEGAPA